MEIFSIKSFTGRNIHSHKTLIKMTIDIGDFYKNPTKDLKGFNEKLLQLFPGMNRHCCSLGYEGGFVDRLKEGTYMGHVIEHMALELQGMLGYEVFYGKTRCVQEPSVYAVFFEYNNEKTAVECGKSAVEIALCLAEGRVPDMESIMLHLWKITSESELGPSTRAIYNEAKRRGIPVTRLGNESLLQLGYGKYSRLAGASLTDSAACISVDMAGNKQLTKELLAGYGIPVPYGDTAYTEESTLSLAKQIGYPVVIKPGDANQGKGVTLNISCEKQVRDAFREAAGFSRAIIVEKFIGGKDYRVLVVGDKVSAVSERRPPFVTGDGVHTVRELVDMENRNPLRGEDHEKPLTRMKVDVVARQTLEAKGLNEEYVPREGEAVSLRGNGNLSTGGTARDCTEEIHPYNSHIAVKAAKILGLDIAGVDITAEDISRPLKNGNGAVIEVNAAPGLRMHLFPTSGKERNVAGDILDMLFPEKQPVSVPIISITGTNGKTTTTRLVRHTISMAGKVVGMTSTSGVYIGDECVLKGDNTGPVSARMVLSNKQVEAAVLETARGGIVRRGLGYDLADVGVIVNISDDHIGLDGLNTIEDLAFAKALVIEAVKPDGYAVLNADDPMTEYLLKRAVSKVMLFSREGGNELLSRHMESGGKAVFIENGSICIFDGKRKKLLLGLEEIPITYGGLVKCNIENSLAATSALYALEVPPGTIKMGLKTFRPDTMTNPGRFNMFDMGDFKVMLDYSHNTAGYNAVIDFIRKTGAKRLVGVVGMPGDRLDRNIIEAGEICGRAFDKIYIKEDNDLRGRKPGEVAGILLEGITRGGTGMENVEIVLPEIKALEKAILNAQPGDLIVMFYEEFEPAADMVNRFKAELMQSNVENEELIEEIVS